MKRAFLPVACALVLILAAFASGSTLLAQEAAIPEGKWLMEKPMEHVHEGYFTFQPDGRYELYERHDDGTGVTRKGAYRLRTDTSPARLAWGPDDLDGPGAEWTTLFAIYRILPDGKLEIRVSESGDYPDGFAPKGQTDGRTMILVRE